MKTYKAPWSTSLIVMSSLASLVLIAGAVQSGISGHRWLGLGLFMIICGGVLFTVRGYSITHEAILVHRLFWSTPLPLSDLQSAEVAPDIMRGGIRLFGNGGLFSFTGWFSNGALGRYRAFVTDPHRTVVLRYPTRRVVVSPGSPDEFVHHIVTSRQAA